MIILCRYCNGARCEHGDSCLDCGCPKCQYPGYGERGWCPDCHHTVHPEARAVWKARQRVVTTEEVSRSISNLLGLPLPPTDTVGAPIWSNP